ncbi:hypothetical protein BCR35DRAFT_65440 [Leucosporidium creatinivorum]|uniref:Uncharacterized protein n=1 Tax=Leucosporidium creatinivorum TaxID=106004 RepID=A0A1Y2FHZ2_9BASI|nr:hypothetical protein BCR35DRAFT_65440 [Leucosporidium creatinivorum]
MATPERIFGPTTREFESRTFVRIQCQGLRDWMGGPDARVSHDDPLDATVKPVPTVYAKLKKGDEWVPMSFWLRWPQWNVGLMDVRGR